MNFIRSLVFRGSDPDPVFLDGPVRTRIVTFFPASGSEPGFFSQRSDPGKPHPDPQPWFHDRYFSWLGGYKPNVETSDLPTATHDVKYLEPNTRKICMQKEIWKKKRKKIAVIIQLFFCFFKKIYQTFCKKKREIQIDKLAIAAE